MPATVSRSIASSCEGINDSEGVSAAAISCSLAYVRDGGDFPAGDSVLRHGHEERAVGLVYGQRGLPYQAKGTAPVTGILRSTNRVRPPFPRPARPGPA